MDKFVLKYKLSNSTPRDIHSSWLEVLQKQTQDSIIKFLKKHLHDPAEYILYISVSELPMMRKKNQHFFRGYITGKDGTGNIGLVEFDYLDNIVDIHDFKSSWLEIDCQSKLISPEAKFVITYANILPSPKEYEIICERSAERFINKINKSVSFPVEIECDYPDVIFEICYENKIGQAHAADTLNVVEEYVTKYNKRHENGIHYVEDVTDTIETKASNAVYIQVDFGDCDIDVLALVIKAIGKSGLPIRKIKLK